MTITGRDMKAKPGRPRKSEPWRPGVLNDVADKAPGFRYRWCRNEPDNIRKKMSERWFPANKISGVTAQHEAGTVIDGKPMSSTPEFRELTLMAMAETDGKARDEFFRERTERQTIRRPEETLSAHQERAPAAPFRGGEIVQT